MFAAMAQAEIDDLSNASSRKPGQQVADLSIRVVRGGVEQRGGKLDFEGFAALDEIDERRDCVGQTFGRKLCENLRSHLGEFGLGLDEVVAGLGVFDERGSGVDIADEERSGFGGEASLRG